MFRTSTYLGVFLAQISDDYRFGFNGKEHDPEWNGNGNMYEYGFRIYDPRIAKFLSVDPLMRSYPWYTPYQFAGNKPIWAIDLDGLEEFNVKILWSVTNGGYTTRIEMVNPTGTQKVNYTFTDKDGKRVKTTSTSFLQTKEKERVDRIISGYNSNQNNYRSSSTYFDIENKYEIPDKLAPDKTQTVNTGSSTVPINDNNSSTNAGNSTTSSVNTSGSATSGGSTNSSGSNTSSGSNSPTSNTANNSPSTTITNITSSTTIASGTIIRTTQINFTAFSNMYPPVPQSVNDAVFSFANTNAGNAAIINLAQQLNAKPSLNVIISGNTDFSGSWNSTRSPVKTSLFNGRQVTYDNAAMTLRRLGNSRAIFVRNALINQGVNPNRITTQLGTRGQTAYATITI